MLLAVEVIGPGLVELPAFGEHVRLDDRDADRVGQLLQLAEDQRAVRPRAGERDIEVIAPGLRLESAFAGRAGRAVGRHPVAELRVRTEEAAAGVNLLAPRLPFAVDEPAHPNRPSRGFVSHCQMLPRACKGKRGVG